MNSDILESLSDKLKPNYIFISHSLTGLKKKGWRASQLGGCEVGEGGHREDDTEGAVTVNSSSLVAFDMTLSVSVTLRFVHSYEEKCQVH